jgi:hypothetical protein
MVMAQNTEGNGRKIICLPGESPVEGTQAEGTAVDIHV